MTKVQTKWCIALLALIVLTSTARAGTVRLFNTGVDSAGIPLAGGSPDPNWSIVAGPGITSPVPAVVLDNQNPANNHAQSSDSHWVWVNSSGVGTFNSPYTIQLGFDLTGFDPNSVTISGSWAVDNTGYILLNGTTPTGQGALSLPGVPLSNFSVFHSFTISGGFISGINTLDFVATDTGVSGGLNVSELTGFGVSVPEPASAIILGVGMALVLAYARWRGGPTLAPKQA